MPERDFMSDAPLTAAQAQSLAEATRDAMYSRDRAAQALGIQIQSIGPGAVSYTHLTLPTKA